MRQMGNTQIAFTEKKKEKKREKKEKMGKGKRKG